MMNNTKFIMEEDELNGLVDIIFRGSLYESVAVPLIHYKLLHKFNGTLWCVERTSESAQFVNLWTLEGWENECKRRQGKEDWNKAMTDSLSERIRIKPKTKETIQKEITEAAMNGDSETVAKLMEEMKKL